MEKWNDTLSGAFEAQVFPLAQGADVFLDAAAAELLHWMEGGPAGLLTAKPACVRRFSPFERPSGRATRALLLLADPVTAESDATLADLLAGAPWDGLLLLSAVTRRQEALDALAGALGRWRRRRGEERCRVEVKPLPLPGTTILPRLWMLPRCRAPRDGTLLSRLNSLLDLLRVREEVFAVGKAAAALAGDLVASEAARERRKRQLPRAGLVLVERALDLVSVAALQPGSESPLDAAARRLPPFPGLQTDVAVDLRPLGDAPRRWLPAGCLADVDRSLLARAAVSKQKELLAEVCKRLVDAAAAEELDVGLDRVPSRISADLVEETVRGFRAAPAAVTRHAGLLQLALALAQAQRRGEAAAAAAAQTGVEKTLLQLAAAPDEQEALLVRALREEAEASERTFSFDEAVAEVVFALSLMGPAHEMAPTSWNTVTVSLTHLLCEEIHAREEREARQRQNGGDEEEEEEEEEEEDGSPLLDLLFAEARLDSDEAPAAVQALLRALRAVQDARADLRQWSAVTDTTVVPRYRPLLEAVAQECAGPRQGRAGSPDLAYMSSGLRDMLKSGLSYFVQTSTPHPSDAGGLLLVLVLGPVSWAEYRAVARVADAAAPRLQMALVCCGGPARGPRDLGLLLDGLW